LGNISIPFVTQSTNRNIKIKRLFNRRPQVIWVIKNHLKIYQTDEGTEKQGINELVKAILENNRPEIK